MQWYEMIPKSWAVKINGIRIEIHGQYGNQANFALKTGQPEPFVNKVLRGRWILRPDQKKLWAESSGLTMDAFPPWGHYKTLADGTRVWIDHPGGIPAPHIEENEVDDEL